MAEYYPLLSKAVGSLPNSTPETRRVVYERARKALIGQLRTLHPPIPDEDIESESVQLDRAIERVEADLAAKATQPAAPEADEPAKAAATSDPVIKPDTSGEKAKPTIPPPAPRGGAVAPVGAPRLATRMPTPRTPAAKGPAGAPAGERPTVPGAKPIEGRDIAADAADAAPGSPPVTTLPGKSSGDEAPPRRSDAQRPIAPQPASAKGPKRRMWIIPAGLAVIALVGVAAWQLRDRPDMVSKPKVVEQPASTDSGKIAERVDEKSAPAPGGDEATAPATPSGAQAPGQAQTTTPAPNNPEVPIARRAALLVEVKGEGNQQSQVKTFLGTVVWKLNNVSGGPGDNMGLAVEADVEVPEDKLKAVVTFEKNTDSSLPASHTIKVRFIVDQGSFSGDVKQISVPQMRREDNPSGEALAGVTVPVVPNTFLVGLSPGNAESANLELMKSLQWIDVPMLLDSGKIAKLTFEKGDSGQRDLAEAIEKWQK